MQSHYFETFMHDLCKATGACLHRCFEHSFCLSADVSNAYDPIYGETCDKRNNTPDFLIYYKDGTVEAVEVKHEAIRKNQRDYIYRRRLFIDNVARPNGWRFTEYIKREDKKR